MKKLTALGISGITYLTLASPVFAVQIKPCPQQGGVTGTNFSLLCNLSLGGNLITNIVTILFVVATLLALGFLIFGGIKWILSGGEKEKIEGARNTIVAALIGLVITFLAYFVINLIFTLFNLGDINDLRGIPSLNLFN
ncbi:MAG: hypothetical protein AAB520_01205 [Patescibacteria group bacterium]